MFTPPASLLAAILITLAKNAVADPTTNTHITFADYENYLYRDDQTSVQLVFNSANSSASLPARFLAAFPADNSGAVAYFRVPDSSQMIGGGGGKGRRAKRDAPAKLQLSLVDGSLRSVTDQNDQRGIGGQWTLNRDAELHKITMGSVRSIRDLEAGQPDKDISVSATKPNTSSILYTRYFFDNKIVMQFTISSRDGKPVKWDDKLEVASLPGGTYDFKVTFNKKPMQPLEAKDFIRAEKQSLLTGNTTKDTIQSLAFLAYKDKLLAGGWHFLTYFGRDTMISVRLLQPLLSADGIEAALSAVFERANTDTGEIAHEETIGDYASWIHRQEGHPELGATAIYDYKMIDPNLELLPLMASYFLEDPAGKDRIKAFLGRTRQDGKSTYAAVLDKNVQWVLARAKVFSDNPQVANLVHIKDGQKVGNWRDSEVGLGGGRIPYDVNAILMPASLLAIEKLANASVIAASSGTSANTYRQVWEQKAPPLFKYKIADADKSLNDFLVDQNLPDHLLTTQEDDNTSPEEIYALSLNDNGSPVAVLNSDFAFGLMYEDAQTEDFMRYVVTALKPFPRGLLMDGVGMLIANPVYEPDRKNWNILDRTAYHGTCVWAFQQTMVALGLDRQLAYCNSTNAPAWCSDGDLVTALKKSQCRLWATIDAAAAEADLAETWTWTYDADNKKFLIRDPLELSSRATEPDAVQLWSFTLLAAQKPDYCPWNGAAPYGLSNLFMALVVVAGSLFRYL